MFDRIRIVLVNTSHPGNIGAAARAMKNMGFSRLVLVSPESFPHEFAQARAAGADDILENAQVVDDLSTALKGCDLVFASSARARTLSWPLCNPRECAEQIAESSEREVALVFGRERTGLTNDELSYCQHHISIPTEENFSSLNLAAAVQVMAYEIRMTGLAREQGGHSQAERSLATADQMTGLYQHLEKTLTELEFIDPKQPKMLMQRLKRLFSRAEVDVTELNILRGILSAVDKKESGKR